jgi:hypothetical protein
VLDVLDVLLVLTVLVGAVLALLAVDFGRQSLPYQHTSTTQPTLAQLRVESLEGNPEVGLFGVDLKGQDHWIRLPATTCEASKLPHDDHLDSLLPPHLDLVPLVCRCPTGSDGGGGGGAAAADDDAAADGMLLLMVVVIEVVVVEEVEGKWWWRWWWHCSVGDDGNGVSSHNTHSLIVLRSVAQSVLQMVGNCAPLAEEQLNSHPGRQRCKEGIGPTRVVRVAARCISQRSASVQHKAAAATSRNRGARARPEATLRMAISTFG